MGEILVGIIVACGCCLIYCFIGSFLAELLYHNDGFMQAVAFLAWPLLPAVYILDWLLRVSEKLAKKTKELLRTKDIGPSCEMCKYWFANRCMDGRKSCPYKSKG